MLNYGFIFKTNGGELLVGNNSKLLISITVPIYNVEKQLSRCVESLLNQTYKNIEVILVDDGSSDKCPGICDQYQEKDTRVVVIHKQNEGLSEARNTGLNASKGNYIIFVDSDDYIELDSCERFIGALKGRKTELVVGEANKICGKFISYFKHTNLIDEREYSSKEYIISAINAFEWYAPVWLNMYCRGFLIENSLYFKKGILHEDMQILPHIFLKAKKVVYMNYCFYNYDIREDSITQKKDKSRNREHILEILYEWKIIFDRIEDNKLQEKLYGILAKQFLYSCREFNIDGKRYLGNINFRFLVKYSLNYKEKLKALIFGVSPKLYLNLKK